MAYKRVYAQIDLNKIKRNLLNIKAKLSSKSRLCAVIKADGYGHGAVEIARAAENIADSFAVATIEEALQLRENGVEKPILILGFLAADFYGEAVKNNITLTIFTFDDALRLSKEAEKLQKTAKIHIALDTGMGRIGFLCKEESIDEIRKISALPRLETEGVFTHFATADEADKTYARQQSKLFFDFCEKLKAAGISIPVRHCSNSAAIMEMEECRCEMVRSGIVTYGLYPSGEVDKNALEIAPALSLKTHIAHIKTVPKGTCVSYGATYTADKKTVVATIPVGYADGYPRLLSNRGRVLIHGASAPIIGRVCMDQFMVDVTGIEAKVGDDVTLIGRDGSEEITADEIAALAETINYEIVCGISKRVPRVYEFTK